jgi:hypothetical protein
MSEDISKLPLLSKILKIRSELLRKSIPKSGKNPFGGFEYWELEDITPHILELCEKYNVFTLFSFRHDLAILSAQNIDNFEEVIEITSPMPNIEKLPKMNMIQVVGTYETYQRRYLYLVLFDIIEKDCIDSLNNTDKKENGKSEHESNQSNDFVDNAETRKYLQGIKDGLILIKTSINRSNILNEAKYDLEHKKITKKQYQNLVVELNKEGIK